MLSGPSPIECPIAEVVGFLGRAQLLTEDRAWEFSAAYLAENAEGNGAGYAYYLVRTGVLTKFQAERIAAGEWNRLTLGPYVLQQPVGQGSLGTMYRAIHRADGQPYAVMVLPMRSIWHVHLAKKVVHQFAELAGHPAVVPLADIDTANGFHYLAWPFVPGQPLDIWIARRGPLTQHEALKVAIAVAEALAYCRRNELIHGCLRPSKIMHRDDGTIATLEWGVGAILSENIPEEESFLDTISSATAAAQNFDCAAPELMADPLNRTEFGDQYSFGCTLFFLLSGQYPFPDGNVVEKMIAHQTHVPDRLSARGRRVPDALDDLIARLLAKDPKARYPDWNEPLTQLRQIAALLTTPPKTDQPRATPAPEPPSDLSRLIETIQTTPRTARPPSKVGPRSESNVNFELSDTEGETENSYGVAAGGRRSGSTGNLPYLQSPCEPAPAPSKPIDEVKPIVLKGRLKTGSKSLIVEPQSGLRPTDFSLNLPDPISNGDFVPEFAPAGSVPRSDHWFSRLVSWIGSLLPIVRSRSEPLQVCLFGTPIAPAGETIRLQAFVHPPKTFRSITTVARAFAPGAELLATGTTDAAIPIGGALQIHVGLANAGVAAPLVSFVYNGETQPKSFDVHIAWECPAGAVSGVLSVALNDIRIARIPFAIQVEGRSAPSAKRSAFLAGR
jgi:serine/threonine protein kinase